MNPRQTRSNVPARRSRLSRRPQLESLESRQLLATFQVTNASDADAPGTLRRAILDANRTGGADRIEFGIPGEGTQTIRLGSPLPEITDTVVIDGYTQSDQANYYGKPLIELVGPSSSGNAINVAGAASKLIGLAINGADGAGIRIGADDVTVTGCFVGAPPVGGSSNQNAGSGIVVASGRRVTIGGTQPGQLNVIAASGGPGIQVEAAASTTMIIGNMIGLDGSGQVGLPNAVGILVNGASFTRIGGTEPGQSNVISGNTGAAVQIQGDARFTRVQANRIGVSQDGLAVVANGSGVQVLGGSSTVIGGSNEGEGNQIGGNRGPGVLVSGVSGTLIQGNWIGTDAAGVRNLGNGAEGIRLEAGTRLTSVGGLVAGAANTIAFNAGAGVSVVGDTTQSNPILSNAIFANRGLGIDLGGNGVTPNSGTGTGAGPNALQPYPVITKAATAGGRTLVQGSFSGVPNTTYRIQYFASATANASGFGEGQRLVGQQDLTTNSLGSGRINVVLETPTGVGEVLSTTVTTLPTDTGNTSEFSNARPVAVAQQADLVLSLTASPDPGTIGTALQYTLTVFNRGPDPATDVNLEQLLPTGVALGAITSTQGTTTVTAGVLTAKLGTLAPGASARVTVVFTPNTVGILATSAEVFSGEIDIDGSNNAASLSTRVGYPADLSVTLRSDPSPAVQSRPLEFVAIVTNQGPGPASGVVLRTPRPVGSELLGAYTGQGTVTIQADAIIVDIGTLASSSSAVVRLILQPTQLGTLGQTVSVTTQDIDPNLANNSATATATVLPAVDLALSLAAAPSPVALGEPVQLVGTISNSGPSEADDAVAQLILPAGLGYVSATTSQGGPVEFDAVTGRVRLPLGTLAVGSSASFTVTALANVSSRITTTATIASGEIDLAVEDNTAAATVLINPSDLAIVSQSTEPAGPLVGQPFDLVLQVQNRGPFAAEGAVLTQVLPAGLTVLGGTASQGTWAYDESTRTVTATLDRLDTNGTATVRVRVQSAGVGAFATSALVSTTTLDQDSTNDVLDATVFVGAADLAVSQTASSSSPFAGDSLVFTVLVRNNGPATATDVRLADSLPSGLQLVSATTTQGQVTMQGSTLTGRLGDIAPGRSVTVVIATIPLVGGLLTHRVSVTGGPLDSNPTNNVASLSIPVANAAGALGFEVAGVTVDETAATAVLTVRRTSGLLGAVSVKLQTVDGTAKAGVNFKATSEILHFADGQTSQSVSIPLIRDGEVTPDLTFRAVLSAPTGGASLAALATQSVLIRNADRDTVTPVLGDVVLQGPGARIEAVTLRFSERLDPARASDPANYRIVLASGSTVPVQAVRYDPALQSVVLTTAGGIAPGTGFTTLSLNAGPGGLTDRFGNPLAGAVNGRYDVSFARGSSLRYSDADGDQVSLQLSRGGVLELIRTAQGDARVLRLNAPIPSRSVLSGTVRRSGQRGNGATNLGRIDGLQGGVVRSTLTTGPFYVDSQLQAPTPPRPAALPRGPLSVTPRTRR